MQSYSVPQVSVVIPAYNADSDDLWEPNPDVSIAFCATLFFGKSKFVGKRFQDVYPPSPPITFAKVARRTSYVSVAAILRRKVFTRVGLLDEAIRGGEEFELWLRALHGGCRIEAVAKVLCHYRRHDASLFGSAPVQEKAAVQALAKWRGQASLAPEERAAVEGTYLKTQSYLDVRCAVDHIHKGEYSLARTAVRRACKWSPKWRHRAAQIGLAVWPRMTRAALRGIS